MQSVASKPRILEAEVEATKNFLQMPVGEKLKRVSNIRYREVAIEFVKELVLGGHQLMIKEPEYAVFLDKAVSTLKALEANGNVQLQLTNFIVGIES